MIKVLLIEGIHGYVVGPWIVIPRIENNKPIMGDSVMMGMGVRLICREPARDLAMKVQQEMGGTVTVDPREEN